MSREKGFRLERVVAEMFRPIWPDALRGHGQDAGIGIAPDVANTPFWVESKFHRSPRAFAALRQAEAGLDLADPRAKQQYRWALAVVKANHQATMAILRTKDLYSSLQGLVAIGEFSPNKDHANSRRGGAVSNRLFWITTFEKRISPQSALKLASSNCPPEVRWPVALLRLKGEADVAVLDFDHFIAALAFQKSCANEGEFGDG
jgi:hypothetical protein